MLGLLSTGFRIPRRGVLLSLGPKAEKFAFTDEALIIRDDLRLPIFATAGTAAMLQELGLDCRVVGKTEHEDDSAILAIEQGEIDLVINVPRTYDAQGRPDGFHIRRAAIDYGVPLITDPQLARMVVEALRRTSRGIPLPRSMLEHSRRSR